MSKTEGPYKNIEVILPEATFVILSPVFTQLFPYFAGQPLTYDVTDDGKIIVDVPVPLDEIKVFYERIALLNNPKIEVDQADQLKEFFVPAEQRRAVTIREYDAVAQSLGYTKTARLVRPLVQVFQSDLVGAALTVREYEKTIPVELISLFQEAHSLEAFQATFYHLYESTIQLLQRETRLFYGPFRNIGDTTFRQMREVLHHILVSNRS